MLEAMNTGVQSSCLAGTLVALGRQAVSRPGDIGVVSSNRLAAWCKQYLFDPALVDMFDLTLWLGGAWAHVARGPLTKTRCVAVLKTHRFFGFRSRHARQDTFCGSHPSAPLLTDTRRLTVGPGTCEDIVTSSFCDRSAVLVVEYVAPAPAASACSVSIGYAGANDLPEANS